MEPLKLYAELQLNPKSIATYRKLVEYYKSCKMENEAKAFEAIIKELSNDSPNNKEQ